MKILIKITLLFFIISLNGLALSATKESSSQEVIAQIYEKFKAAKYEEVVKDLSHIESELDKHKKTRSDIEGLIHYWKGISYIRINEFDLGIKSLEEAIRINYKADDLFYEYGQALYVAEQLSKARLAFKQSVKNKFKIAVSLYYIAYISQQLNDNKKAVSFYNMIEKLPEEESKEILQASRMQIADIYLQQVEKLPDSFTSITKYVIPQYEKALEHDPKTSLAKEIKDKIQILQRRYDLVLFKMRNGRPTATPRYFLKANLSYNIDDNVNSLDKNSLNDLSTEDYASHFTTTGFNGRYTFYPSSAVSVAPVVSAAYTKYQSDSTSIITRNNYYVTTGVQFNYEHLYNKAPATTYLNIDYTYNADDSDADKKLSKLNTVSAFTLSESLQFWLNNPTIFRYKYSETSAEVETQNSSSHSFIWEQLINKGSFTLYTYTAFDFVRYKEDKTSDSNIINLRGDLILPTAWGLFNPNFFLSNTMTNYIENSARGITSLYTYGFSLNKPLGNKFYGTLTYSLESQTGDLDTDVYTGSLISFNLDYFY